MLTREERKSETLYDFLDYCSDIKYYKWWKLPLILLLPVLLASGCMYVYRRVVLSCAWYIHLIGEGHSQNYAFKHSYNAYDNVYILLNDLHSTEQYVGYYEYFMSFMIIAIIIIAVVVGAAWAYNVYIEHLLVNDIISSCREDVIKDLIEDDTEEKRKVVYETLFKFRKRMRHKGRPRIDLITFALGFGISIIMLVQPIILYASVPRQNITNADFSTFSSYATMYLNYNVDDDFKHEIDGTEFFE